MKKSTAAPVKLSEQLKELMSRQVSAVGPHTSKASTKIDGTITVDTLQPHSLSPSSNP